MAINDIKPYKSKFKTVIIDFLEIPQANIATGHQDSFEKFARDFLTSMGYIIVEDPSRGADGGMDIKVQEKRIGVGGETNVFWLVSCKHFHSKTSVSPSLELNILDRVISNRCDGFIGFYSTVASSGLLSLLEGLNGKISYQVFDNEKIEHNIVGVKSRESLFLRYFPKSYSAWKELNYKFEPIPLFTFYLETTYKDEYAFKAIFGSTEEIIDSLREFETLSNYINNHNNKDLIVFEYPARSHSDFGNNYAQEIIRKFSLKPLESSNSGVSIGYKLNEKDQTQTEYHIIYDDYIITNNKGLCHLEEVFRALKSVIKGGEILK